MVHGPTLAHGTYVTINHRRAEAWAGGGGDLGRRLGGGGADLGSRLSGGGGGGGGDKEGDWSQAHSLSDNSYL